MIKQVNVQLPFVLKNQLSVPYALPLMMESRYTVLVRSALSQHFLYFPYIIFDSLYQTDSIYHFIYENLDHRSSWK